LETACRPVATAAHIIKEGFPFADLQRIANSTGVRRARPASRSFNEGKLVAIVAPDAAEDLLAVMRDHALGRDAALIGEVTEDEQCFVQMTTSFGGGRIVDWLAGEQLPRIC
jgi:hydrogenase maturation factor